MLLQPGLHGSGARIFARACCSEKKVFSFILIYLLNSKLKMLPGGVLQACKQSKAEAAKQTKREPGGNWGLLLTFTGRYHQHLHCFNASVRGANIGVCPSCSDSEKKVFSLQLTFIFAEQ